MTNTMHLNIETESEMFGVGKLKNELADESRIREDYDKAQLRRIKDLELKIRVLEDYLDIEFKTYPESSQYIKTNRCTKL